jgi:glycosyltransferase involved in cell wall biosynthesis
MMPCVTIFTPVYNRAHLMPRAHASLTRQAFRDFEWVVVDDGSSDDIDLVMAQLDAASDFPIIYVKQPNSGRHMAINRGVELARGQLFMILDSDDWLTEDGLEQAIGAWRSMSEEKRRTFCGIWGQCLGDDGELFCTPYPADRFDSNHVAIKMRHGFQGESCHLMRTDVRRRYPFPDFKERYCAPSLVWNRIALDYPTRFVNIPFQYKQYQEDGLNRQKRLKRFDCPLGFRVRDLELAEFPGPSVPWLKRRLAMIDYVCASLHAGYGLRSQAKEVKRRFLWLASLKAGFRRYRRDKRQFGSTSSPRTVKV